MPKQLQDKLHSVAFILPAPDANLNSGNIALGQSVDEFPDFEVGASFPPLNATLLPDDETVTVTIQESQDGGSAWETIHAGVITGAGGKGADTLTISCKPLNQKKVGSEILTQLVYRVNVAISDTAGAGIEDLPAVAHLTF